MGISAVKTRPSPAPLGSPGGLVPRCARHQSARMCVLLTILLAFKRIQSELRSSQPPKPTRIPPPIFCSTIPQPSQIWFGMGSPVIPTLDPQGTSASGRVCGYGQLGGARPSLRHSVYKLRFCVTHTSQSSIVI